MMKIDVDPTSIQELYRLADTALQFPNRVQRARVDAAEKAVKEIKRGLGNRRIAKSSSFGDSNVIPVEATHTGGRTYITIKILKADTSGGEVKGRVNKARMSVNIAMYGRRGYTNKKQNHTYYLGGSRNAGYPTFLQSWRVPPKPPNEAFRNYVKVKTKEIVRKHMLNEIRSVGFGPRGGATGLTTDFTGLEI